MIESTWTGGIPSVTYKWDSYPCSLDHLLPPVEIQSTMETLKHILRDLVFVCKNFASCNSHTAYCFAGNNSRRFSGVPVCRKRLLRRVSRKKVSRCQD